MSSQLAVNIWDVHKKNKFGFDISGLNLSLRRGNITAILGGKKSGKSLLLKLILGQIKPDQGQGQVLGYDLVLQREQIRRQSGYFAPGFMASLKLSVEENICFVANIYGLSQIRDQILASLTSFDLYNERQIVCADLPEYKQRNLELALATIHKPRLLLLDEPFNGLDPLRRSEFTQRLKLLADQGVTIILSTAILEETEFCDDLLCLHKGQSLIRGSAKQIIKKANILTMHGEGRKIEILAGEIHNPAVGIFARVGEDCIYVSAQSQEVLENSLKPWQEDYKWQAVSPKLEDAVIKLLAVCE